MCIRKHRMRLRQFPAIPTVKAGVNMPIELNEKRSRQNSYSTLRKVTEIAFRTAFVHCDV
jgi:hypothetical protein